MTERKPFDCKMCEALWQRENVLLPNLKPEELPADHAERFCVECSACNKTFDLGTHCDKASEHENQTRHIVKAA